jgi:hypothetical protein
MRELKMTTGILASLAFFTAAPTASMLMAHRAMPLTFRSTMSSTILAWPAKSLSRSGATIWNS